MGEQTGEVRLIASSRNWIEGAAVQQLEKTAALPGMKLAVGLPDLHPGKGTPIGAAFITEGCLYPTLVGNDVGCGIGLWRMELSTRKLKREAWADRLRGLDDAWDGDPREFLAARGIAPCGCEHSLGTIGGGNHFAELQAIERVENVDACARVGLAEDAVYLCVHSGSRGLGEAILREQVEQFGFGGLAADSPDASHYVARHDHARQWAAANRELIAIRMMHRLRTEGKRLVDLCHNSVTPVPLDGQRCWLHRKGAAPADEGAVLIPGSRGAHTYVMLPKSPGLHNAFSLAHGAGRKWSRSDSRGRLEGRYSPKDLTRSELGSYVICEDKELLYEEAPQAYKNIDVVIGDLVEAGLADVVAVLKPLVTYKVKR